MISNRLQLNHAKTRPVDFMFFCAHPQDASTGFQTVWCKLETHLCLLSLLYETVEFTYMLTCMLYDRARHSNYDSVLRGTSTDSKCKELADS